MQRVLSGIQPTGQPHIGNYLGMLKQAVELQREPSYERFYFIADLHALTVRQDPKTFAQKTLSTVMDLLALGVNPEKSVLFVQSQVPQHTELMWILNTITPFGELQRMTQWKEKGGSSDESAAKFIIQRLIEYMESEPDDFQKIRTWHRTSKRSEDSKKGKRLTLVDYSEELQFYGKSLVRDLELHRLKNVNSGLLNYPVLMAADILLYKPAFVPVGEDQVQHVELARVLVRKFNKQFDETFPEPKAKLTEAARIMSLTEPTKKMSKSHGEKSYIALTDEPDVIRQKLNKAVTATSGGKEPDPGVANLFTIMREVSSVETVQRFEEQQKDGSIRYAEFKKQLADDLAEYLMPFRKKRAELVKKTSFVKDVLEEGRKKASVIAQATMEEVREKVGLLQ